MMDKKVETAKFPSHEEKISNIHEFPKTYPDRVIRSVSTTKKVIALTFDGGPDNEVYPDIVELLNEHKIKATFFDAGIRIEEFSDIFRKTYESGHEIANHTYSHPDMTTLNKEQFLGEINKASELIKSVTNKTPLLYRPPYTFLDENTLEWLDEDYKIITWSFEPKDWDPSIKASDIIERFDRYIISKNSTGDIVCMHARRGTQETLKALPTIISNLRNAGYEFVTVGELVGVPAYKEDAMLELDNYVEIKELASNADYKKYLVKERSTSSLYIKTIVPIEKETLYKQLINCNHFNILPIYKTYNYNKEVILIQENVDGITLREKIGQGCTNEQLIDYMNQICDGLKYLHSMKPAIVFNNITPDSILIGKDDWLYLTDFGKISSSDNISYDFVQLAQLMEFFGEEFSKKYNIIIEKCNGVYTDFTELQDDLAFSEKKGLVTKSSAFFVVVILLIIIMVISRILSLR